ncbi:PaaI family thioesterase [Lentimicrobium sp. L6]|uniref:PaaI family thioesterase n=1 Tax=Lentimicrobium sp. L6 TaxID=2735916 RepID=UPI0015518288|nr:PaaI family thioesterase [Lentimicrobium sp. L6]NPD85801.1 PaaI family thioesterase [Lentimicrobium sp. L6]
MTKNPILSYLKQHVNKPITKSMSPSALWLKGFLVNVEEGFAEIEYTVRKEMTNPLGTLQGGVMAALIDDTMGMALFTLSQKKLVYYNQPECELSLWCQRG